MKVKITLLLVQCNNKLNLHDDNYLKVFFDEKNEFPSKIVTTKNEWDTLKEICEKYFKLDYLWLTKTLANFRIYKNNNEMIAEAVYIIQIPEIIGFIKKGKLLSFKEINNRNIGVDSFYEKILTTSGRPMFR